jgi:hypothetical protein
MAPSQTATPAMAHRRPACSMHPSIASIHHHCLSRTMYYLPTSYIVHSMCVCVRLPIQPESFPRSAFQASSRPGPQSISPILSYPIPSHPISILISTSSVGTHPRPSAAVADGLGLTSPRLTSPQALQQTCLVTTTTSDDGQLRAIARTRSEQPPMYSTWT